MIRCPKIGTVPGKTLITKSTSFSCGKPGNSSGNTKGNSFITRISSKFTCPHLESSTNAKKASHPFLRNLRACIVEITLDRGPNLIHVLSLSIGRVI